MPRTIINAQGREEPFDLSKVVASILTALRKAEYRDESEADHIAPMVEYALSRYFGERPPTVDDVAHCIEQALRSLPGLNEVADAYVESRRRRQELAAIEDGIIFDAEGPKVASRSDYSLHGWDRARLEAALVREHGLPLASAQAIAGVVEMQVRALELDEVSTSLLRELVDAQLAKHGVLAGDFGIGQLSLPTWDIEQAIFPQEDTLSDSALGTPRELERFIAQAVMRQFSWRRIHHAGVREATLDAKIAFADSGQPQRYFRLALDTRTLFEENAGVSGLPFFGERVATLPDAVERVAQVLALAVEHAAHEVVLLSFDSAFAPLIRNRADLTNLVPTLRERLSDLAQSGVQVALAFDALAGRMDRAGSIDLLNAWLRESVDAVEAARTSIETRIAIGDASADDPLAIAALSLAVDVALLGRPVLFRFERAGRSTRRRSLFGESIKSVRSVEVVSSFATLNVIAPLLSGEGWEESALLNSLAASLETLMEGLSEREGFVRRFHLRRRDAMPSPSEALGRHWANSSGIVEIGLVGLYEYARALAPNSEPTSEGFRAVIDRLLGFLKLRLDELAEELGIEARFVGLKEGSCANALSNTSRHRWPERFEAIVGALSRELSEGAELPTWVDVRAEDRLNVEGKSHGVLKAGVATLVHEHERLRADEIRELVLTSAVARDAKVRAIRYQVSLRQCARCAIMARPEVRVCPACGSREWRMPHGQKLLFGIEDEAMPEGN